MGRTRLLGVVSLLLLGAAPGAAVTSLLVKDINPVPLNAGSFPNGFVSLDNGLVLFIANDGVTGQELWRTDGTADGTRLLTDPCEFGLDPPGLFAQAGDRAFFLLCRPDDSVLDLWVTCSPGTASSSS